MFMEYYPPDAAKAQGKPADKCDSSENHSAANPNGACLRRKLSPQLKMTGEVAGVLAGRPGVIAHHRLARRSGRS
jgi:hypothetical protein